MNWKTNFVILLEITLGLLLSALFNLSVPATFGILVVIGFMTWWTFKDDDDVPPSATQEVV